MKKLVMFGALALSMLSLTAVAEDAKPIADPHRYRSRVPAILDENP